MRHYKNIEALCDKAVEKGYSFIKDYRTNGYYCHNHFWNGGKKYEMDYSEECLCLRHYGTITLQLSKDLKSGKWFIDSVYGESKSDCDSINQVLEYFRVNAVCHYYPSKELFQCIDNVSGVILEA